MEVRNGKSRSSEFGTVVKDCQLESSPGCVGTVTRVGREYENNKVAVGGKDSDWRDTTSSTERGDNASDGKVIDQLADEVEKEINYYKSHVSKLESRLKELRELSGELNKIRNSD